jgi:hypothetical protein
MAISGFSIAAKTIVDMTCGPFPVARRILTAPLKDETDRQLIRNRGVQMVPGFIEVAACRVEKDWRFLRMRT